MRNSRLIGLTALILVLTAACEAGGGGRIGSEIVFGADAPESSLLRGFYPASESWRWTEQEFAFTLRPPSDVRPVYFELDFAFPEELAAEHPAITLTVRINGIEAGNETYRGEGRYLFSGEVPEKASPGGPVEVLVQSSATAEVDGEDRGVIVVSAAFKEYDQTAQYRQKQLEAANRNYEELLRRRTSKFPIEKQKEMMKVFHDLGIWDDLHFHGIKIVKNPLDLWMMQQIIYDVQPDFIIETGAGRGGSSLYWAQVLNGMGLTRSRVLTVDLEDNTAAARNDPLWDRYVTFFLGNSTDPNIVDEIAHLTQGGKVIVCLDSDNSMEHVLEELRLYSPLVSSGSYVVVEDTHYDAVPTRPDLGPGPAAAVRAFLSEGGGERFERDLFRESLILTSNPGGWLRRR
jgi:cephalosporin hydroxylase